MRNYLLPSLFFCSVLLLFFACRRTELQPETQKQPNKASNGYERFFVVPASSSKEAKTIAEAVKKQDAQSHFVSDIIESRLSRLG